jgi:hypothetical protein
MMTQTSLGELQKSHPSRGDAVPGRSLNDEARKRELVRISHENEAMLQRIMAKKPNYNYKLWEEDRKVQEKLLVQIKKVRPAATGQEIMLPRNHIWLQTNRPEDSETPAIEQGGGVPI